MYPLVTVGSRRLRVPDHALLRYRERVVPAFDAEHALEQLRAVISHAAVVSEAPAWARDCVADEWVVLTEGIIFPVRAGALVTCLTRGGIGDLVRENRSGKRQRRSEQRNARGARKKYGAVARESRRDRDSRREKQRAREEMGA